MPQREPAVPGLRERKKAKTRAAIQTHALRLFREHGYDATTIEQIADAAEVSQSTFFRYFPTKADLVTWDEFDPLIMDTFRQQPSDVSPVAALHCAFDAVFAAMSGERITEQQDRIALMLSVPELRAATLDQLASGIGLLATLVAERTGRDPDDPGVRTLAGAITGTLMVVMLRLAEDPTVDVRTELDTAMTQLEQAFTLPAASTRRTLPRGRGVRAGRTGRA